MPSHKDVPEMDDLLELGAVGYAASKLSPRALHESLDEAAEILRGAIGAEGLEVFYPYRGELCQLVAQGPGAHSGSNSLPPAEQEAPSVTVELNGGSHQPGSVVARFKELPVQPERAERILRWASAPLESALLAEQAYLKEAAAGWSYASLPRFLEGALETLVQVGRAKAGTLILYGRQGQENMASSSHHGPDCALFHQKGCNLCPVLKGEKGFTLASNEPGGEGCQGLHQSGAGFISCMSLMHQNVVKGAVLLAYDEAPQPPSRYVNSLNTLADVIMTEVETRQWPTHRHRGKLGKEHGLHIRCLGHFELWESGKSLPAERFRRAQALTLLKILLLRGGQPVSRDELCELLWPGADPTMAIGRLHVVVHDLRQGLEPDKRPATLIKSAHGQYRLNLPDPQRVDLYRFRDLAAQGKKAESQERLEEAIDLYEEAVALYRGDLFADEPHSEWFQEERQQARDLCLTIKKSLAQLWARAGHPDKALQQAPSTATLPAAAAQ